MTRNLIIALAIGVLILGGALAVYQVIRSQVSSDSETAGESENSPALVLTESATEQLSTATLSPVQQRLADAKRAHEQAVANLEKAEEAMGLSEQDADELEQYLDNIEARGEEPSDYAEEGLALFQPAFERYEKAADQLDQAIQAETKARYALEQAQAEINKTTEKP